MSRHVNEWPSNQTTHYTPILAPGAMLVRRRYKPGPATSQRRRVHNPGIYDGDGSEQNSPYQLVQSTTWPGTVT